MAQQRQHRRASEPEVVVLRPALEDPEQFRGTLHQRPCDRDRQLVDQGPRLRLTDQSLQEGDVRRAEERFEGFEQQDRHPAALEYGLAPKDSDQRRQHATVESLMPPLDRPNGLPQYREPDPEELEIALQVSLFRGSASRIAMATQLDVDCRGDGRQLRRPRFSGAWGGPAWRRRQSTRPGCGRRCAGRRDQSRGR